MLKAVCSTITADASQNLRPPPSSHLAHMQNTPRTNGNAVWTGCGRGTLGHAPESIEGHEWHWSIVFVVVWDVIFGPAIDDVAGFLDSIRPPRSATANTCRHAGFHGWLTFRQGTPSLSLAQPHAALRTCSET
eukprot:2365259-Rhodomonas_salina.2